MGTREVAQRYIDLLCAGRIEDAFGVLAEDATYKIIGQTPLSAPMKGRKTVIDALVPALATFKEKLKLTYQDLIVDGDRAVILASGKAVGPLGLPYVQPNYALVLRIKGDYIVECIEFMDTVEVETKLAGKKLVAA